MCFVILLTFFVFLLLHKFYINDFILFSGAKNMKWKVMSIIVVLLLFIPPIMAIPQKQDNNNNLQEEESIYLESIQLKSKKRIDFETIKNEEYLEKSITNDLTTYEKITEPPEEPQQEFIAHYILNPYNEDAGILAGIIFLRVLYRGDDVFHASGIFFAFKKWYCLWKSYPTCDVSYTTGSATFSLSAHLFNCITIQHWAFDLTVDYIGHRHEFIVNHGSTGWFLTA